MVFETSPKIDEWIHKHNKVCKSNSSAGEHYQFEFLPTGIVEVQTAKCLVCGKKKTVYLG